jgi:hypothetical protein
MLFHKPTVMDVMYGCYNEPITNGYNMKAPSPATTFKTATARK